MFSVRYDGPGILEQTRGYNEDRTTVQRGGHIHARRNKHGRVHRESKATFVILKSKKAHL